MKSRIRFALAILAIALNERIDLVFGYQLQQSSSLALQQQIQVDGIFDRAVRKMTEKEDQANILQTEKLVKHASNLQKATRQAMLIASPIDTNFEDVAQIMKTVSSTAPEVNKNNELSYSAQIDKIAKDQPEYVDEYEGFGSLTEMIKNKDQIAQTQQDAQDKKDSIKRMKEKLAQTLSKPVEKKPEVKVVEQPKPKPVEKKEESSEPKKLTEEAATQVVEEVQMEQDSAPIITLAEDKEAEIPEQQGFISKYEEKIEKKDSDINGESQSSQQNVEEDKKEGNKGMLARFADRLKDDEEDGKKATEVVQAFQHALNYKNKSVVDRASERFMEEEEDQFDELIGLDQITSV